jgi:hypothetical protein
MVKNPYLIPDLGARKGKNPISDTRLRTQKRYWTYTKYQTPDTEKVLNPYQIPNYMEKTIDKILELEKLCDQYQRPDCVEYCIEEEGSSNRCAWC